MTEPRAVAPKGRVALVTGATGSLGPAVVRAFAADGWRLGLGGTDRDRLAAVADGAGLRQGAWAPAVGDLSRSDDTRAAVDAVVGRFGQIDAVLHLVGGYVGGTPVVDVAEEELRSMLDQHLMTAFHVVQAAVPAMVARGWGRFVAISPTSTESAPRMAPYGLAKAAAEVLLRSLAREVASTGVTVNVVVVRAIDARHERESATSPKNASWTTPEEVAAVLRFLCSDEGAPINGARIPLNGRG